VFGLIKRSAPEGGFPERKLGLFGEDLGCRGKGDQPLYHLRISVEARLIRLDLACRAAAVDPPVENIPLQAERHSGGQQKVFAFPPERRSPSDGRLFGITTGMLSGFRPESRSAWTRIPHSHSNILN
jgi:hypothetical protein